MQNLPNQTISLLSHFSECVNFFYSSCSFADKMQYQFFNDELTILNDWERSDIGWQLWWWLQVTSQNIYIKYSQIYIERRFAPKMQITNSKLLFAQLLFFAMESSFVYSCLATIWFSCFAHIMTKRLWDRSSVILFIVNL